MQKQFAANAWIKIFLQQTTLLVRPIQNTRWHIALSQQQIDISSHIVVLVFIVLRSTLSQIIGNADFGFSDIPLVFAATIIITVSGTCFFIAIVLIVEWISGLWGYTKGAAQLLHALILPLLYVVKIEPLVSRTAGFRISLFIAAVGWMIIAFVLRYVSAWVLLL